ncbi:MAG: U-box domain-containing protein [Legionella sp.]
MGCFSSKMTIGDNHDLIRKSIEHGITLFREKRLTQASQVFSELIINNPCCAEAFYYQSLIDFYQHNQSKAFNNFSHALKLQPLLAQILPLSDQKFWYAYPRFYNILKQHLTFRQRLAICYQGEIPERYRYLQDPISLELMDDPITLSSGHTYDRNTIEQWFAHGDGLSSSCPLSRKTISWEEFHGMTTHVIMRNLIERFVCEKEKKGRSKSNTNRSTSIDTTPLAEPPNASLVLP